MPVNSLFGEIFSSLKSENALQDRQNNVARQTTVDTSDDKIVQNLDRTCRLLLEVDSLSSLPQAPHGTRCLLL